MTLRMWKSYVTNVMPFDNCGQLFKTRRARKNHRPTVRNISGCNIESHSCTKRNTAVTMLKNGQIFTSATLLTIAQGQCRSHLQPLMFTSLWLGAPIDAPNSIRRNLKQVTGLAFATSLPASIPALQGIFACFPL